MKAVEIQAPAEEKKGICESFKAFRLKFEAGIKKVENSSVVFQILFGVIRSFTQIIFVDNLILGTFLVCCCLWYQPTYTLFGMYGSFVSCVYTIYCFGMWSFRTPAPPDLGVYSANGMLVSIGIAFFSLETTWSNLTETTPTAICLTFVAVTLGSIICSCIKQMVEAYTSLPALAWAFNSTLIGYLALLYSIGWLDYKFIINDSRQSNYVTVGYLDSVSTGMYNTFEKKTARRALIEELENLDSEFASKEIRRRLAVQLSRRLTAGLEEPEEPFHYTYNFAEDLQQEMQRSTTNRRRMPALGIPGRGRIPSNERPPIAYYLRPGDAAFSSQTLQTAPTLTPDTGLTYQLYLDSLDNKMLGEAIFANYGWIFFIDSWEFGLYVFVTLVLYDLELAALSFFGTLLGTACAILIAEPVWGSLYTGLCGINAIMVCCSVGKVMSGQKVWYKRWLTALIYGFMAFPMQCIFAHIFFAIRLPQISLPFCCVTLIYLMQERWHANRNWFLSTYKLGPFAPKFNAFVPAKKVWGSE